MTFRWGRVPEIAGSWWLSLLLACLVLAGLTCNAAGELEKFMVCTGSSLELPAVREAAGGFDYLITGAYGYNHVRGDTLLAEKCIVYTSLFDLSRYGWKDYDVQPSPSSMGHEKMPLVWGFGFGSYAYDLTDPWWPVAYVASLQQFMEEELAAGVLVDNWHVAHEWWTEMDPAHYAKVHPDSLPEIMARVELQLAELGELHGKVVLLNGPAVTEASWPVRYWETFGWRGPWNTLGIWRRCQAGDFIYCSTGEGRHRWLAKVVGALRKAPVGLGLPDGERLVDEDGQLLIPRAEDF